MVIKKIIKYLAYTLMLLLLPVLGCYYFLPLIATHLLTNQLKQQGFHNINVSIQSADFKRFQLKKLEFEKQGQYQLGVDDTFIHYGFSDLIKGRLDNITIDKVKLKTLIGIATNKNAKQTNGIIDLRQVLKVNWSELVPFERLKIRHLIIDHDMLKQSLMVENIQFSKEAGLLRLQSSVMDFLITIDLTENKVQQLRIQKKGSSKSLLTLRSNIDNQHLTVVGELDVEKSILSELMGLADGSFSKAQMMLKKIIDGDAVVNWKLSLPLRLDMAQLLNDINIFGTFKIGATGFEIAEKGNLSFNAKGIFDLKKAIVNWRLDTGSEWQLNSEFKKIVDQQLYAYLNHQYNNKFPEKIKIINKLSSVISGNYDISDQIMTIAEFGELQIKLLNAENNDSISVDLDACNVPPLKLLWFNDFNNFTKNSNIFITCQVNFNAEFISMNLPTLQINSKVRYEQGKVNNRFELFVDDDVLSLNGIYSYDLLRELVRLDFVIYEMDIANIMMIAGKLKENDELSKINIDKGKLSLTAKLLMEKGKFLENSIIKTTIDDLVFSREEYSINGIDAKFLTKITSTKNWIELSRLHINSVDAGISVSDLELSGKLIQQAQTFDLYITDSTAHMFGGLVSAKELHLNSVLKQQEITVFYQDIVLAELVKLLGRDDLQISGTASGELPLIIDDKGNIRIDKGKLNASENGGQIKFHQSLEAIKSYPLELQKVVNILEDFHYKQLAADVSYGEDGILALALSIKGSNPNFQNNREVHLNLNVTNNIAELLKSLRLKENMEKSLEKRVNESMDN